MTANAAENDMTLKLGGCGGVFLFAPAGELWIDIEKQELGKGEASTFLRAMLFGPDRSILDEFWLEDAKPVPNGPAPVQRGRLKTKVEHPGLYGVMITATGDRYGDRFSWGFRTNCPRYLVETSRGHRDTRHSEPVILRDPTRPGDVCFLPWPSDFAIEVSNLPKGSPALTLFDAGGKSVASIPVDAEGNANHRMPADASRGDRPWRLHFPKSQAVVHIDGLTRWESKKPWMDLSLWTPRLESWFALHENRWLIGPDRQSIYTGSAANGSVLWEVHNNAPVKRTIALNLEFDSGAPWSATLSKNQVTLAPGRSQAVAIRYQVPPQGDEWACRLRASAPETGEKAFSTWSSLTLKRGAAPADGPSALSLPLVLKPWGHENAQFGYNPSYPRNSELYFDPSNRAFVVAPREVWSWNGSEWKSRASATTLDGTTTGTFSAQGSKIAFDGKGRGWLVGRMGRDTVLLRSEDGGASFRAVCKVPAGGYDIEQFSGQNSAQGPPPLVHYLRTSKEADPKLRWRSVNDISLLLPEETADGKVVCGDPIPLSQMCIGISMHSGIPSNVVSRGKRVHVTWAEATDPADKTIPGVPTYAATYDRVAKTLSKPALIGYGPPANDAHNTPCITMDSKGFLHVLVGTHGRTFKYARSLQPDSAAGGWTPAEDVGPGLPQTYVGLVCGPDDTLHLVFRIWTPGPPYFQAGSFACLGYMRKPDGEGWSAVQPLVAAAHHEYSVFYHRLTIDRRGRLFLSYDYWSTFWFYRTDRRLRPRAVLMSDDAGMHWRLASDGAVTGTP